MASQQTPNYKLSRWAGTDRILMEEFNDNWDKIDTALAARNCQFYTTTYIGTGEMKFTLTFPKKPVFFFISRVNAANLSVGIQGATHIITFSLMHTYNAPATWTDNSVTIECTSSNLPETGNYKDHKYLVSALLDANG